jgi:hypothetical protein
VRASELPTNIWEELYTEASYPGNLGAMEMAKFFMTASPEQKAMMKKLIELGEVKRALSLLQRVTGVKLQGKEYEIAEDLMYRGYRCRKDCSGHMAGYEWARQRNIADADACPYRPSHPSFHEGCRSYAEGNEE